MVCPNCKTENPDTSRFCASCGTALAAGSALSRNRGVDVLAERRQLTVMSATSSARRRSRAVRPGDLRE